MFVLNTKPTITKFGSSIPPMYRFLHQGYFIINITIIIPIVLSTDTMDSLDSIIRTN